MIALTCMLALTHFSGTKILNHSPEPKSIRMMAEPFPISEVKLTGGDYEHANEKCAAYLLTVEPDRLLHSFLQHSKLEPKGKIYGGWEDSGLAGHSLGHYLTACSQQYANSKDARFKAKVDYIVSELARCQKSRPDGYVAAMPDGDKVWAEVKKGDIRSHGFDLNGLWSPWYTHHKVLAGLVDSYELTGNKTALQVAEKFADWAIDETKDLTPEQWQKMLGCEYGGMNDVLAELYAITHQTKYLDLSRKFYDTRVLDPLAEGKDDLPGRHSNTQIPKIIGLARLYELTGQEKDKKTAEFFWDTVINHHTYVIGGNSNHEYFGPADKLSNALSSNTCETCNTYNMLKLTRHLFEWDPKVEYADYYERAHLNDILASQNPESGMMCYFVPLSSGAVREYSNPFDDWTCCHGTGMENHTKHADSVYFRSGKDTLYVNQFIPTMLDWKEGGLKLTQETAYPNDGKVSLKIQVAPGHSLTLLLRHPTWAEGSMNVTVNGTAADAPDQAGQYVKLSRKWHAGDVIQFTVPMAIRTEPMPDNAKRIALLYGPAVLAASVGDRDAAAPRTPVLVTEGQTPDKWLHRDDANSLTFSATGVVKPQETLQFKPFYKQFDTRYAVYFDEFTSEQWAAQEAEYRAEEARQKDLEARTVDFARVGEMQPERDHQLKSEGNDVREANGRSFRTPLNGGWFELILKVDPNLPCALVTTFFGNERMNPSFEILVNGQRIATETLPDMKPNLYFDETHAIPEELTKGKTSVVVRVQATAGRSAGSVAGMRVVHK